MAHPGVLHRYTSKLVAFEHTPSPCHSASTLQDPSTLNTLLWVGGLGDGLLTVDYPTAIAKSLPPNWRLAHVVLTSAYNGWATGSLKRDAEELGKAVVYFRELRGNGKVVLMGHSTGCQDLMEYIVGAGHEARPTVNGMVLQAGVSDREALVQELHPEVYNSTVELAQQMLKEGRQNDILPRNDASKAFGSAMTAYRWLSLASPDKNGDDDYFSSDLDDEKLASTFGKIVKETPVMFLFSGSDEHVPGFVDKKGLVERWTGFVRRGGGVVDEDDGGVVEGASHNLNGDGEAVVGDLVKRVLAFLGRVGEDRPDWEPGSKLN
ncbi:DUF1749-domain-containing protein [Delitschia confertaspora ATCC 74209]|uniref:DUF1749-domain-containing protein n=1 Tax=Delitschia confertaspora ATCC 74209 TaxID=1513339 RepID=A0A9P4JHY7_9PLEO|nr:DUF1749-domain-containing protein [Delitschia confertaspora ATCC 74209]